MISDELKIGLGSLLGLENVPGNSRPYKQAWDHIEALEMVRSSQLPRILPFHSRVRFQGEDAILSLVGRSGPGKHP